jgi:hypothetical protein
MLGFNLVMAEGLAQTMLLLNVNSAAFRAIALHRAVIALPVHLSLQTIVTPSDHRLAVVLLGVSVELELASVILIALHRALRQEVLLSSDCPLGGLSHCIWRGCWFDPFERTAGEAFGRCAGEASVLPYSACPPPSVSVSGTDLCPTDLDEFWSNQRVASAFESAIGSRSPIK